MSYAPMKVSSELKAELEELKDYRLNTLPKVIRNLIDTKSEYKNLKKEFFDYKQQANADAAAMAAEREKKTIFTGAETKQAVADLGELLNLSESQVIEFLLDHYHMSHNVDKALLVMWMSKK